MRNSDKNKNIETDTTELSVEKMNERVSSFDKKMNETRREYVQKSLSSKMNAKKVALSS